MRFVMFFAILLAGIAFVTPWQISAQTATPAQVVREFYKFYVHALNKNDRADPINDSKTIAAKYVTASLLAKIRKAKASEDGIDADYFLSAQDWDKDWELEKNMIIGSPVMTGSTATIHLVLKGKMINNHKLKIVLKKESGAWKIDKVNDWNL